MRFTSRGRHALNIKQRRIASRHCCRDYLLPKQTFSKRVKRLRQAGQAAKQGLVSQLSQPLRQGQRWWRLPNLHAGRRRAA